MAASVWAKKRTTPSSHTLCVNCGDDRNVARRGTASAHSSPTAECSTEPAPRCGQPQPAAPWQNRTQCTQRLQNTGADASAVGPAQHDKQARNDGRRLGQVDHAIKVDHKVGGTAGLATVDV
jgi:hypothetical protein